MGHPIYLAELTALVWPRFLRSGTAGAFGTMYTGRTRVPVNPASTYTMRTTARKNGGADGLVYGAVQLWDASGAAIGAVSGWASMAPSGGSPGTNWTTYTGDFGAGTGLTLPVGAAWMAPVFLLNSGGTVGTQDCMECMVALSSAPTVALTADRYMRDSSEWMLWPGTAAGSWCTLTAGGDTLAQQLALRFATAGYQTLPSDTPANTFYDGRLLQPGLLRQELPPDFTGMVSASYGELVLINGDGALSEMVYHGLDGQQVVIKRGYSDAAYSTFATVMTATMEQAVVGRDRVRVRLRGPDARLEQPLLAGRYAGNNVLPAGLEGSSDLAGQPKPRVYGAAENITPPCVNTSRLIYQVSDSAYGCTTTNVRDAGVALAGGAVYADQADMEANAPAAGEYRVWQAGGMFRLGSTPAGRITCDAEAMPHGAGQPAELWNVLYQMAYDVGVQPAEFYQAQSATWPRPDNWVGTWSGDQPNVGLYVDDLRTASQAMAQVARSLGVWFGFTRTSTSALGAAPKFKAEPFPASFAAYLASYGSSLSTLRFDQSHILGVQPVAAPGQGRGVPVWKVDLSFRRNYSQLSAADMPSLAPAAYGFLAMANRRTQASDPAVLTKHATAQVFTQETCLLNDSTGAGYEANRQLLLRKQPRPWFEVRVSLNALLDGMRSPLPVLGSYVYLAWPELRLVRENNTTASEGWFNLMALETDWARNEARLTVRQATEVIY